MRRLGVGLAAALAAGALAQPANARSTPTLRLSGARSGFVDVTLRASLAAYSSDPGTPIAFSSLHDVSPGRYRAFLLADGPASVTLSWPGGKSATYSRLRPTRVQVATADLTPAPAAPAIAGLTRLPIETRATTVVMSGLRWESGTPAGAVRLAACLVAPGQVCEQTPAPSYVDQHVGSAGAGSYTQFYDAEGQQRLATNRPEAVAEIASADAITFARSYVIALDAAG